MLRRKFNEFSYISNFLFNDYYVKSTAVFGQKQSDGFGYSIFFDSSENKSFKHEFGFSYEKNNIDLSPV